MVMVQFNEQVLMMSQIEAVHLTWVCTPEDLLKQTIRITETPYVLWGKPGKFTAEIPWNVYQNDKQIFEKITNEIKTFLIVLQSVLKKKFTLNEPSVAYIKSDGHRIFCVSGVAHISTELSASLSVCLPDGTIEGEEVFPDKECINLSKKLHGLRLADEDLDAMLVSYSNVHDFSENALVYLYEIRDKICNKFKGEKIAREMLGIEKNQWNQLGKMANHEPYQEGRHRGKFGAGNTLIPIPRSEIDRAKKIAYGFILKYVDYLGRTLAQ